MVGLNITSNERSFIAVVCPGKGDHTSKTTLNVTDCPTPRVRGQHFLGGVVDTLNTSAAHVKFILSITQRTPCSASAVYPLGRTPPALLPLHHSLVVSQVIRGPFSFVKNQQLALQTINQAGIKTAVGIPRQTGGTEIDVETKLLMINTSSNHLLGQVVPWPAQDYSRSTDS